MMSPVCGGGDAVVSGVMCSVVSTVSCNLLLDVSELLQWTGCKHMECPCGVFVQLHARGHPVS